MSAHTAVRPPAPATAHRRVRLRVEGVVQGVGFRPYVHRLAGGLGLGGWVLNDARGVLAEVEGPADAVARFLARLPAEAPPLAAVERVACEERAVRGERAFAIRPSPGGAEPNAPISADGATCAACLAELLDPADRRHRYPFITCTDCGPRFTIVEGIPYDRARTTMAAFPMCAACRAEYEDPANRRFHAEPIACPDCGPVARLVDPAGAAVAGNGDAVATAAAALLAGRIVAVKGLGGYHLACRADDVRTVARLRARKHREDKPFALMVRDARAARALVVLGAEDERLLRSSAAPIVLAPRRDGVRVAPAVAPGSGDLGVMLPATPLHHLLVRDAGLAALVMTSGNLSDEPIAYEDADARTRLAGIADLLLVHDRPIAVRVDDSVVRVMPPRPPRPPLLLRRARGHVPRSVPLPVPAAHPILGCGAELKCTFCLAKGDRAWMSHHLGDLRTWEVLRAYRAGVAHFETVFAAAPRTVVHDLHPDYLSTAYAQERAGDDGIAVLAVQHHHAHFAACLAEHGWAPDGRAVGAILDGAGLGDDGTIWGGELLVGDTRGSVRAGHLHPVPLPGGDRAAAEPWRMACAWLGAADIEDVPPTLRRAVPASRWAAVAALARSGRAPVTTSAGRLFDAIAAIAGLRAVTTYEGQAAMELEAAAAAYAGAVRPYPLDIVDGAGPLVLDARVTVAAAARDAAATAAPGTIAARFHGALAGACARGCAAAAEAHGLDTVVLSGGVWQNRLLLTAARHQLEARGLRVLVPERLPPNDGGIAYGQVAVAAARRQGAPSA